VGGAALHELDLINSNVCLPCPKGFQPETAHRDGHIWRQMVFGIGIGIWGLGCGAITM